MARGRRGPDGDAWELPPLVDHHCHGVVREDPGDDAFASYPTESGAPAAPGTSFFDTQSGFAVRRCWTRSPHCPPGACTARRREPGAHEAGGLPLDARSMPARAAPGLRSARPGGGVDGPLGPS